MIAHRAVLGHFLLGGFNGNRRMATAKETISQPRAATLAAAWIFGRMKHHTTETHIQVMEVTELKTRGA